MWTLVPECGKDAAFTYATTSPLPVQAWLFLHSQMSNNCKTVLETENACSKNHSLSVHLIYSPCDLCQETPKAKEKSAIPEINYSLQWFQYLKIDSHDCKAVCYV